MFSLLQLARMRRCRTVWLTMACFPGIFAGCAMLPGDANPNRHGDVTVILTTNRNATMEIPDLDLVFKNTGHQPEKVPLMADLFWGEVIVRCGDALFVLRQPKVWVS